MEEEGSSSEEYLSAEEGLEGGLEEDKDILPDSGAVVIATTPPPQLESGEEQPAHPEPSPTAEEPSPTAEETGHPNWAPTGDVTSARPSARHDIPPLEDEAEPSYPHVQEEMETTPPIELSSNEGHVETAVDQMLVHEEPAPAEVTPGPPAPPEVTPASPTLPPSPTPIPPPRRKRKKKYDKSSLENLTEVDDRQQLQRRSYSIGGTNPRRDLETGGTNPRKDLETSLQASTPDSDNTPERDLGSEEEASQVAHKSVVMVEPVESGELASRNSHLTDIAHHQLLHNLTTVQDRSRSNTPTPAISIQPEVEWTSGILSGPESEVVTSDTSLAKARGSTTTSSVLFASDDESVDGLEEGDRDDEELVFADSPDDGEDDRKDNMAAETNAGGGAEHMRAERQASPVDTDKAILMSTMVKNLDTGEVIPLSAAEERIPQGHGWSPLSEHLIRRTKEMAEAEGTLTYEEDDVAHRRRPRRFRKLKWGRKKERMAGDLGMGLAEEAPEDHSTVKYKQSHKQQGKAEFERVRLKQDLTGIHIGAIWTMEFSICGRLLATAGQDSVVRVWVLTTASHFFHELQSQYQRLGVHSSVDSLSERASVASSSSKSSEEDDVLGARLPFQDQPLCSYCGHTSDVLDLSWSKNFFLLSSSMDKTVRLWHISRKECLCCFQHVDFVTAIAFHPRDDRYFLSGSLDGKLRLWNIPDKRVALWNEIEGVGSRLITAANFCMNGKLAVVGTYDGRCIFYDTEHLKYHTQIHVKSRHGKNKGRKISGVEPLPGEDKLLVTSNDSRVRLYNLKDHELSCKYKGYLNTSSQIKATFSRDGQYIISGSEDNFIYIWKTHLDLNKLSSARRDRNEFYESFTVHSDPVTTAVFAPVPGITVDEGIREVGEMVVAADYQGCIKIYVSGEQL